MKRMQLFLGTTTCLLAIAGVAASKAARFMPSHSGYYCTKTNFKACIKTTTICGDGNTFVCKKDVSSVPGTDLYTIYTFNFWGDVDLECNTVIPGDPINSSKCRNVLTFVSEGTGIEN